MVAETALTVLSRQIRPGSPFLVVLYCTCSTVMVVLSCPRFHQACTLTDRLTQNHDTKGVYNLIGIRAGMDGASG
jgi:hypothetical protein